MCSQLDISNSQLCGIDNRGWGTYTAEGIIALADAIKVNGSLTECNVRGNQLDSNSATMLAAVATKKRVMLFGLKHGQTEANFSHQGLKPADAILIANDLRVSSSLTSVNLLSNDLDVASADMLLKVKAEKLITDTDVEVAKVIGGRDGLVDGILPELVDEYDRLFQVREGLAVCAAESQYCQGCYTQFTVNDLARLQGGRAIVRCASTLPPANMHSGKRCAWDWSSIQSIRKETPSSAGRGATSAAPAPSESIQRRNSVSKDSGRPAQAPCRS